MSSKISFIHTADLHLGSFIHSSESLPEKLSQLFAEATLQAFSRICDAAIDYQVDFLILAGDIYDRTARSVLASNFFNQQCERLKKEDIPVYMIAGNHDPIDEEGQILDLPENLFLFSSKEAEIKKVVKQNGNIIARIIGQSYQAQADARKMYNHYRVPDNRVWNIALLHTQLDLNNNNYVPCRLSDLTENQNIHYWALGHIHQKGILQRKPVVAYPGIPQGRDFGEQGPGGALFIKLFPHQEPDISFIPTSSVIFKRIEIPLSEPTPLNLSELKKIIANKAEEILKTKTEDFFKGYVVKWVLTGRGKIHNLLTEQGEEAIIYLKQGLQEIYQNRKPFLWTDSIIDLTGAELPSLEELKEHHLLYRKIASQINQLLTDKDMYNELLNDLGLIWTGNLDHEKEEGNTFQLTEERLQVIIEKARELILEGLLSGEESF